MGPEKSNFGWENLIIMSLKEKFLYLPFCLATGFVISFLVAPPTPSAASFISILGALSFRIKILRRALEKCLRGEAMEKP